MAPMIRKATRIGLDLMLDWATREGWNPGLDGAAAFFAADPDGYWVAQEAGAIAAAVSVVRFGADYAFLGFYLAHPDYRGQRIGHALWTAAVAAPSGLPGRLSRIDTVVPTPDA